MLLRPKLLKLHRLSEFELDTVLPLARHGIVLPKPMLPNAPAAPDPGEQFLRNLLASRAYLTLVISYKLLQAGPLEPRVITPQEFFYK